MATATDVKARAFTSSGSLGIGRTRLKAVWVSGDSAGGDFVITDGNGGATMMSLRLPANVAGGTQYVLLPGDGILAYNDIYVTMAGTTQCTVFYG